MKALIYYGNKNIKLENSWQDPKLNDEFDSIIKINYTSICATDIEAVSYTHLTLPTSVTV